MASVISFLPLQEGSGDPSPENVRPITAPVHIVGKNLFDESNAIFNQWTEASGVISTINKGVRSANIPVFPSNSYSVGFYGDRPYSYSIIELDTQGSFIRRTHKALQTTATESPGTLTITTSSLTAFIYIQTYTYTGNQDYMTPERLASYKLMLEQNSTGSSSYESYTETPVYGGYLDIGNGEVVEEWTYVTGVWGDFDYGADLGTHTRKTMDLPIKGDNTKGTTLTDVSGVYLNSNSSDTLHYYLNKRGDVMYSIMPTTTSDDAVINFAYPLLTPITHTLNSAQLAHIMAELNVRYSSMLESRRRILMSSPHVKKLSTETAFFKTDLKAPLKECKISFTPVQEGSGDPSPTNIRPINCWTKVNVGQTGKAIAEIVGYSAQNGGSIASTRNLSNAYGTTVSTVDFVAPHGEVTITQTEWPVPETPFSYRNGYFTIYVGNLVFGKSYAVSCRITNITSNPLNIELDNIVLQSPSGANGKEKIIEGDRITWRHIQWLPHSTAPARSNFEIRFCGMSFTMSDFMVTAEDEEDQTYEPYTDTDIVPVTFPYPTRNHLHLVGYSAATIVSPKNARQLTNKYGTVLSTTNPDNSITITQEQWPNTTNVYDYRNGYFVVVDDNLEFGKKYIVSFKVSNITNNPLNVNLTAMKIVSPSGNSVTLTQDGDRLISNPFTYRQLASAPTQRGIDIRNCGMSLTISDIMVTEEDETDQTYVPFKSNFYGGYVDLVKGEIVAEWEAIDCLWKDYVNTTTKDEYGMTRHGFDFVNPVQGYGVTGESRDMFCNIAPKNYTDVYDKMHFYIAGTNSRAYVYLPTETDENTRIVVVARLKEPIHYPIDPVTIKTLKGINTIWTDANGSMDLSYWTH